MLFDLTVFLDGPSAQMGYGDAIADARKNEYGVTFQRALTVAGVGQQATAVYATFTAEGITTPEVNLYVQAGNVQIYLSFGNFTSTSGPSRATMLADDIAMARSILRNLPA